MVQALNLFLGGKDVHNRTNETLEFNKIKELLGQYALTEQAQERIQQLEPKTDERIIRQWLKETTEAKAILNKSASIPLHSLTGIHRVMEGLSKGMVLKPEQLVQIWSLLDAGKKLIRFMKDKEALAPQVSMYANSITELSDLVGEIERCIRNGRVDDGASKALAKVRKKIAIIEDRIKAKLDRIIRSASNQGYFQDQLVSVRDGRYVIPVKKEYKRSIEGHILDQSSSGSTVYIEPAEVKKLQSELNIVRAEEEMEEQKVLSALTGLVVDYEQQLSINIETMIHYDFIFAKAKYSKAIDGRSVDVNNEHMICLKGARHPLLASAVPLDFTIGTSYQALVITGPNTGGKTVAIKTVGLLTLMAQSGLHIPVAEGSTCAIFQDVLVDIGDGQSIEQSLSTFSAHMTNMIHILQHAGPDTLVILDELGAGTDPVEGKGLAISILEKLVFLGATVIATTHFSEIKVFASSHEQFENGSMEFDVETLQPLYRLNIGKAGESQAFSIAYKLGMDTEVLQRAFELTYLKDSEQSGKIREEVRAKSYTPLVSRNKTQDNGGAEIRENSSGEKMTNEVGKIETDSNPADRVGMIDTRTKEKSKEELRRGSHEPIKMKPLAEKANQKTDSAQQEIFQLGDRVYVSSLKAYGLVCELENHRGEVGVFIQQKKVTVNKKRLTIAGKAKDLYPENYDLNIVLQSKEERKKSRIMQRKHVDGLVLESKGEQTNKKERE